MAKRMMATRKGDMGVIPSFFSHLKRLYYDFTILIFLHLSHGLRNGIIISSL